MVKRLYFTAVLPLLCIRWSPDGGTLAVASEDSFVYLYNCGDYIAKAKCGGHNGPVRTRANDAGQENVSIDRVLHHVT